MPSLDEFGLIARYFRPLASHPGALGLEDDAALLTVPTGCSLVTTADALVAGVHFLADDPPADIARKALRVNLSDLAAMGASPLGVLMTTAFPRDIDTDWLDGFADGLARDLREFECGLLGGDTVATPGPLTLSITALGVVESGRELRRSNARSGDRIWVSGTIGDGAFGLLASQGLGGALPSDLAAFLVGRYRVPQPRLALGAGLVGLVNAAMDVSDGLIGDLGHICETSGVGAVVEAERVPLSDAVRAAVAAGLGRGLETALTGGDDYELLFTASPDAGPAIAELGRKAGIPVSEIGEIVPGQGVRLIDRRGGDVALAQASYRHFP